MQGPLSRDHEPAPLEPLRQVPAAGRRANPTPPARGESWFFALRGSRTSGDLRAQPLGSTWTVTSAVMPA